MTRIETTVLLQKNLLDHAEALAQQLNISQNQLFEQALESFINNHKTHSQPAELALAKINQGDIYWANVTAPDGRPSAAAHPQVVIQDNLLNHSRINSVVVCALTSNRQRATEPGNILLEADEGNLTKQSVVVVSQISVIEKTALGAYIGSLSQSRVEQILAGIRFQQRSFLTR